MFSAVFHIKLFNPTAICFLRYVPWQMPLRLNNLFSFLSYLRFDFVEKLVTLSTAGCTTLRHFFLSPSHPWDEYTIHDVASLPRRSLSFSSLYLTRHTLDGRNPCFRVDRLLWKLLVFILTTYILYILYNGRLLMEALTCLSVYL